MKKLLYSILLLTAAGNFAFAQKIATENLPSAVNAAFKTRFSIAKKISWEMDYDNYEADFKVGKAVFSAKFDKDGKWLETISYIKSTELPKVIRESLAKKYNPYKIEEVAKVETEKSLTYQIEIERGGDSYDVEVDEAGEILKEEKKTSKK